MPLVDDVYQRCDPGDLPRKFAGPIGYGFKTRARGL